MESSGSGSDGSGTENYGTSPGSSSSMRFRTDSESSADSQPRFVLPGTAGSPSKVLTLDELMSVTNDIKNMSLVHEIAVNPEFKLQPFEPPQSSLERTIKETIHKAFWDVLRDQLNQTPPVYDQAILLLSDIKEGFSGIILSNKNKTLNRISEVLDPVLIRQQAEQGVLDFKTYTAFVINIMARSCAPVRDEQVSALSEIDDVVDQFRGILETMNILRLDVTNTLINVARTTIIKNSVEYEKEKFKKYVELYKYGFPITENWLKRNRLPEGASLDSSILNAYFEFLDWNSENEIPEMLDMDKDRILTFTGRALRLCAAASTVALASAIPVIGESAANRQSLAKQVEILLQDVNTDKELTDAMENIWLHVKSVITSKLTDAVLHEQTETVLKERILQIAVKTSPVRTLFWNRLVSYVKLFQCNNSPPPPPTGYLDFAESLLSFATAFKRLTSYNYSVFFEYYQQILTKFVEEERPQLETPHVSTANGDATISN